MVILASFTQFQLNAQTVTTTVETSTICLGQPTNVTGNVVGSTIPNGTQIYWEWSGTGGTFTTTTTANNCCGATETTGAVAIYPTATGTFTLTVTTSLGTFTGTATTGIITVNTLPGISWTSGTTTPTVCINTPITDIVYSVTGTGTTSSTITLSGAPTGVTGTYNAGVYTVSGTPTQSGIFNYTVTVSGTCTPPATTTGTITVEAAHTINLTTGSNAQTVCISTAITDITYSVGGSATGASLSTLCSGVSGSYAGGTFTISGTPTTAGTYTYTVTTSGGTCSAATATGTITVHATPTLSLSSGAGTDAQTVCVNTAITQIDYAVGGSATGASLSTLCSGVSGSYSGGTFSINGSPTAAGTYTYTVTTTGGNCTAVTATGTITVDAVPTATLSSGSGTDAQTVCVNNAITSITYTIGGSATSASLSTLCPGVSGAYAGTTFTISGTPTSVGTYTYTVTTSGGACNAATATGTIDVTALPTITWNGASGSQSQTVCQNDPITTILYNVGGTATGAGATGLPAGVTGSYGGGVFTISGSPTASGTFNYTVTTTGGVCSATATGTITVNPLPATSITGATNVCVGQTTQLNETGGPWPYINWVSSNPSIALISAAGLVSGISAGNVTMTLTVGNGTCTNTLTHAMTVDALNSLSLTSGAGTDAQTVCINSAITNITYSVSGSATGGGVTGLPTGVSGSYAAGVFTITGTPTVTGLFNYTVTTSGGTCSASSATGTITVTTTPTISLSSATGTDAQTICEGDAITNITYAVGGSATGATLSTLCTGVTGSYAGGTFTISGTPAAAGTFTYTVTTTGGVCTGATATGTITVHATPTLSLSGGSASQTVCISTAIGTITYSVGGSATGASVTGLPTGVNGSYGGGTFTISGTPTVSGTFDYTVTTSGGVCPAKTATGTITVQPLPTVTLTSAAGTNAQTVCVNTTITTITYSIGGSATSASLSTLCAGVSGSFAGSTLTITGSPTTVGTYTYTVTTSGGVCTAVTATGTITVTAVPTVSLTSGVGSDAQTLCQNTALVTNITYSIGAPATGATASGLPSGVTGSYAGGTFTISGTPTVSGNFSYTVTTTGTTCVSTATGTITVNPEPPLTITGLSTICVLTSTQLIANPGGYVSVSWVSSNPTVALVDGDGTVHGLTPGTTTITCTVYDGTCYNTKTHPMTIEALNAITLTSLPATAAQTVCINTAITPITYSITGSATGATVTGLPTGVSGSYAAGVFTITGTPTVTGLFNYTVTTSGGTCAAVTATGTVTVQTMPTINLTSGAGTNAQTVCINTAITNITYAVGGSATGASASGLPTGVSGSYSGGVFTISGTPTVSGSFSYTVTTSGGTCSGASATGTITVQPAATISLSGGSASQTVCINSPIGTITFAVGGSATGASVSGLPTGVNGNYSGGTFTITGTPTVSGTYNYTVTTSGGVCTAATATGTITVQPLPTVTLTSAVGTNAQTVCVNTAITNITYAVGGSATGASVGGLPTGVTGAYNSGTFTITGTPTTTGSFSYTVTTSGGVCTGATATGTITVTAVPVITLTSGSGSNAQTLCQNTALVTNITYTIGAPATGATVSGLPSGVTGSYAGGTFTISGTPTVSGNFTYTVTTTGTTCVSTATGTITVNPEPPLTITGLSTICVLTSTQLVANPGGYVSVFWISSNPTVALVDGDGTVHGLTPGTTTITCTVFDGTCYNTKTHLMTIEALNSITLTSLPATAAQTVCINTAITNITYSITGSATGATVTGLPTGVSGSYAAGVFTITGTPTVTGLFSYTVTTTGGTCAAVSANGTITVQPVPTISLTSGAGTNAQTVCISTAITNITYAIGGSATGATVGGLPTGVSGSYSGGVFTISGTPTASGTFGYTVTTTGGTCTGATATGTITVQPTPTISLSGGSASQTVCINSTIGTITYAIGGSATGASVTGLPTGVNGNYSGGTFTITGAPTVTGTFNYTVTTSGGVCAAKTATGTITVQPLPTVTLTSAAGTNAQTLCINTALTTITYAIGGSATGATVSGPLPSGVSGSYNGGVFTISGTPTVTGSFSYTVTTSGGVCTAATATGTITVTAVPIVTLTSDPATKAQTVCQNSAILNITYSIGAPATGVTASGLPAGVAGSYAAGTFTISGSPTATGTFNYTVTTTGTPCVSTATGTITVNGLPPVAIVGLSNICVNTQTTLIANGGPWIIVTWVSSNPSVALIDAAGVVSGLTPGTTTITCTVWDGICYNTATHPMTIDALNTITLTSLPATAAQTVCINTAITNITYGITGSATGATVTGLPTGVTGSYAAGVFTITGTPTVTGSFIYTVTTTGGTCAAVSANGTMTVQPLPTVTLTSGTGTNAQTVCINTTITPITYGIGGSATGATVSGLPAGVSGSYSGGVFTITGTPTVTGTFGYTVTTTGGTCTGATATGTITVQPLPTITLTSDAATKVQTVCINTPITTITYAIGGSATGANVSGLPAGVNGAYSGGVFSITGSPTASGTFNYTVTTTGGTCTGATATGTITVQPLPTVVLTSGTGTNAQTVCINTAITNITYAIGGSATGASVSGLPTGVSGNYSGGTFTITGTPTVSGTFNYSVTTSGGTCAASTATGTIKVDVLPTILLTSAPGTAAQTVCANSAIVNITYAIGGSATGATVSGLPSGVTGSYATGVFTISGSPTASGTFNYTVSTSGGACSPATASGTIKVNPLPISSIIGESAVCVGSSTTLTATGSWISIFWLSSNPSVATISAAGVVSGLTVGSTIISLTIYDGVCYNTFYHPMTVDANPTITLTSGTGTDAQTVCINTPITNITYGIGGAATGATVTGLPTGVTGAYSGGVVTISGTPTVSGAYTYTVTTTGGACPAASVNGTITVQVPSTISLISAAGTNAQTVCINTSITNITYSIGGSATGATVSGLPTGVIGVYVGGVYNLMGAPTVSGVFNYTVTTTGSACPAVTATGTITVQQLPTISLTSGAGTRVQTVCINTPIVAITYAVGGSATGAGVTGLPSGVTGSYSGGVFTITGTPTASGTFNYTVTTTGGTCAGATATGTITVHAISTITLTSGSALQTVCINTPITTITYAIGGSATGAGVSGLPTGVSGAYSSGVFTISGTPTVSGTFNYTVTTSGSTCAAATATGTITIQVVPTLTWNSGSGSQIQTVCQSGDPLNSTLVPITYTVGGSATGATVSGLPAGVTGSYGSGIFTISGAPTATGTFNFTVSTTGGPCTPVSLIGVLTVNPLPISSIVGASAVCVGFTTTLSATGSWINVVWNSSNPVVATISAGGVVSGLTVGSTVISLTVYNGICYNTFYHPMTVDALNSISLTSGTGTNAQTVCINTPISNITYSITGSATGATVTGLPAGVTGSYSAGVFTISGSPTASGVFSYTVTTSGGACASATANGTITVQPLPTITLTSGTGTDAQTVCVNTAITTITYAIGGSATGATVSGLPAGVSGAYSGGVFTITGTPTVTGTFSYEVTTSGGLCTPVSALGTITVRSVTTISLTSGAGTNAQTVCINAAITNITYAIGGSATGATVSGLPTGVSGSYSGGVFTITGAPTVSGTFNYTVTTSGGVCAAATATGTITVRPLTTITLTSGVGTNAQTVCINTPITNITYAIGGSATGATVSGLPAGVTGSYSGGVFTISGTPTATGLFNYTVTTSGGVCAAATATGTITVQPLPTLTWNSGSGSPMQTICQTGDPLNITLIPITYTVGGSATGATVSGLPAGVTGTYSGGVFTISGAPTATGTFNFTVSTTGGVCAPATAIGTITVNPLPMTTIVGASAVCVGYTTTLTAAGTWISALWLSSNPAVATVSAAGVVTGVSVGSTVISLTVYNGICYNTFYHPMTVDALNSISLTSGTGTDAQTVCINTPITNITYSITGSATGATVTGLPTGVTGSYSGGIFTITGTPSVAGVFNYTVTTTGGACASAIANGTITVQALPTISLTSGTGTNAQTVCINTAITNITYAIGGSATGATVSGLPAGVTGSYSAGVFTILGTPTVSGSFSYTVTTSGGLCTPVSAMGTITVRPVPTITLTSGTGTNAQTVCINTAITNITYAIGGSATGATVTGLPAGVNGAYSGGVFTITGTPTVSGTFNYTVTTSGGVCAPVSANGTITVRPITTITLTSGVGTNAQTVCINSPVTNITYAIGGSATGATVSGLPAGVAGSYSGGVFTISGTPTATGSFNYTVTTSGGVCAAATATGTITVQPLPTLTWNSGSGSPMQTICQTGDPLNSPFVPITYTVGGSATGATVSGLPAGITGTYSGGIFTISGAPTATGTFNFTVSTTGGVCTPVTAVGTITVNPLPVSGVIGASSVCVGFTTDLDAAFGPFVTVNWNTSNPAIALIDGNGVVTGVSVGSVTIELTVFNGTCYNTYYHPMTVDALNSISLTSATGTNAQTVCINTPITNITYSITGSATGATVSGLPAGVTGSYSGGIFTITGTPSVAGLFNYTVTTTGGACASAIANGTITVQALPTISLTSGTGTNAQTVCINTAIANITYAIGGSATGATVSGLPTGVTGSYSAGVFTIIGTPTVSGSFSYTVTTSGGLCTPVSAMGTITVRPVPTITLTSGTGTNAQTVCINSAITNITYAIGGSATGATVTGLPAGVNGAYSGGVFTITGTPTVTGTFNYTVTTSGGVCAPVSVDGTITVRPVTTITLTSGVGTNAQTVCINTAITNITYAIGGSATGATVSGLPAGVTGSYSGGVFTISGTPTVAGTFNYTVTTTGGVCTAATAVGTITVSPLPILTWNSGSGSQAQTVCKDSPIVPITYTVGGSATGATVSGLPTGVTGTYSAGVFTISGTPTVSGTFNFTVTTSGGVCAPVTLVGSIKVNPLPQSGVIGASSVCVGFTTDLDAAGGPFVNVNWNTSNPLIALIDGNGVVTGIAVGSVTIELTVFDGTCYNTYYHPMTVDALNSISLTSGTGTNAQTVCINTAITNITYAISGSATGATVTGLPAGVTGSYSGGIFTITGTPAASGVFNYTVTTTGGACASAIANGTITVQTLPTIALTSGTGTNAQTVCINAAITNITYAVGGSATGATVSGLPAGVTGAYSGGVFTITGAPTVSGTFNYTVTTTGGLCTPVTANGTITVRPLPTIALTSGTGTNAQTVCINTAITNITYAIGGSATGATVTGLPAGVTGSYSGGVFTITGTPSASGIFNYTVTTSGGVCAPVTANGTITVQAVPTITLTSGVGTNAQTVCILTPITNITYAIGGAATGATITGLPAGVTGSYSGGVFTISGTPTAAGTFNYTITTTGGTCAAVTAVGTITVNALPTLVWNPTSGSPMQTVCMNDPILSILYTVGGSATGATVTGLPAGVTGVYNLGVFTISGAPTVSGTFNYTVTTTGGACTPVTAVGTITVNPLPISTIVGASTICVGTQTTLTATGSWINVVWNSTNPTVATISPSGVVTGLTPGTTIIELTIYDGTCYNTFYHPMTIDALPTITLTSAVGTNAQTICFGSAITNITYAIGGSATGATVSGLPAGVTGAYNAGVFTISGTPTLSGFFTYTLTTTGGTCSPVSIMGTVTVNPIPPTPIVGVVNNCGNSVLTVTNPAPGATFLWSNGKTTQSITETVSGPYGVTQTVLGCTSPFGFGTAAPNPIPGAPTVAVVNDCGSSTLTASGVTGATFLWSTGETTASITVTAAGTYTVYQTTPAGCTSLTPGSGTAAPLTIPVAPTVTVQNFINYSVLTASGYTGTLLWSTGETTASITVTAAGQYCVTQYVAPCTSDPGCGTAAPIPGYTITGHVTYANSFSTPLNGVTVELKNSGGTVIGTAVTTFGPLGERGYYQFVDIVAGTYSVSSPAGGVAVPWGGNNATDALIVQLQAIGAWVPPLTGLYWIAGDVNASSTITALDALYIKQRVVGLITSYPAGDWTVDNITFVLSANTVQDMQALCIGDVNGSYVPATKSQSYLSPVGDMVKTIKVNEPFDYEIKSDDIAEVGAMTLFLDYNPNLFEIISISTPIEGMEHLIQNGTVAVAWSNIKGLSLNSDDAVFTVRMVAKETISEPTAIFTIGDGSEFADNNAIRIENFDLKMGPVVMPTGDMAFSLMNYPNPFSNTTNIVYTIPESGKVKLILTNMFGQLVRTLVDVSQDAGTYSVKVDPADGYLSPGTYLYRIEVEGVTETFTKTNKMVFTR